MITRVTALFLTVVGLAAAPLSEHAREYRKEMTDRILPYWIRMVDATNGGYLMSDDAVTGRTLPREKALVAHARMVWTFSHVHARGFDDKGGSSLKAAQNGYKFLNDHFLDREQGGYFWKTDLTGKPTNERKILYGESFVIYALVEYHRATHDADALRQAMDLYKLIQDRAHDEKQKGWTEHFTRDWKALAFRDPAGEVEVAGLKSANTHLHFMEALAELYSETGDARVKKSLAEALDINRRYFYPDDAGKSCFHRQPDWSEVTDQRSSGLSYGHNVEFAWLMLRAQEVLKEKPAWDHFYAHIDHAMKHGYDNERGGLYHRGVGNEPAADINKIWWVEAEMMAALTDALRHKENKEYREALEKLIHFVNRFQADPKDGIWLDTVTAEGKPKSTGKAHSWKANYHDVRALVKFIGAFEPERR
jgi:mannose/cellobiose epimerase-like protein (N-acyl-D-glucosamine 2-epimerase family)